MKEFVFSQAEKWYRDYHIEAASEQQARRIYEEFTRTSDEDLILHMSDPEYLEDIIDDIEVFEP